MNTQAGYVVYHQHEAIDLTKTLFTHDKLLTARKAAMSYVEKQLAELWLRGDYTTLIEIRLVDSSVAPLTVESPTIARVYRLDLPTEPQLSYLDAKAIYYAALEQLHQEFLYYQTHDYSMGFGYFLAEVEEGPARQVYCHLYDASGYVNHLAGTYELYRQGQDLPQLVICATYEDQHYRAGQLLDELIG